MHPKDSQSTAQVATLTSSPTELEPSERPYKDTLHSEDRSLYRINQTLQGINDNESSDDSSVCTSLAMEDKHSTLDTLPSDTYKNLKNDHFTEILHRGDLQNRRSDVSTLAPLVTEPTSCSEQYASSGDHPSDQAYAKTPHAPDTAAHACLFEGASLENSPRHSSSVCPSITRFTQDTRDNNSDETVEKTFSTAPGLGDTGPKDTSQEKNPLSYTIEDLPKRCYKLSFPQPLDPMPLSEMMKGLETTALKYMLWGGILCYLIGRAHFGMALGLLVIGGCVMAYKVVSTESMKGLEWQREKVQGTSMLYEPSGESVEWLNFIVHKIWRSIDPCIFACVEDILEDALLSVSPSAIVNAVKVSDFDIGTQSPIIQKIRVYPPSAEQTKESILGEASFCLISSSASTSSGQHGLFSTPSGIALRFKTGIKAPIDVKAELTHLSGKILFKILTSPEPPFVSKVTFSFTSVPTIKTSVMPISKHLNVMRLPLLKKLVNEGVKLGFVDLVDPKSMTVDVQSLIGVATQDTSAIGVIKVNIRQAIRDSRIIIGEMEDTYATLSYSNSPKKKMVSTRVLTNEKNPRWDEVLYILVHENDVFEDNKIDIKVWDADKLNVEQMWGSVSISARDAVMGKLDMLGNVVGWCQKERTVFDGWSPIDGMTMEESKTKLDFNMTFHPKYAVSIQSMLMSPSQRNMNREDEEIATDHSSGILSVQMTQAVELEIADPGVAEDDLKHPYSSSAIVSPYAVLYINDQKVYQTRAKLSNPNPYWNAVTEQFIKDYDKAYIRISVKHSVDLERDPVLGTYVFSLKNFLGNTVEKYKESERWIPLLNGIGFGKVSLLVRYKPVKLSLPHELQGADVGTLIIEHVVLTGLNSPMSMDTINSTKANLLLNVDPVMRKRLKASRLKPMNSTKDAPRHYGWAHKRIYFPVTMRYKTAICLHCFQGTLSSTKATGRFWLRRLCDNTWEEIDMGLHDYMSEKTKESNRNEDDWPVSGAYGQVKIRMKFVPGFSPVHSQLPSFNKDMIGADPFHDEDFMATIHQWSCEQGTRDTVAKDDLDSPSTYETSVSDESEDEDTSSRSGREDAEYLEELHDSHKNKRISKFKVLRKLEYGKDVVKHRVNSLRRGFNTDDRAERRVEKE
ncbi:hypothetical protein BDF14DRAFT_1878550 [Spinellus fusiger]|nr:hypothetical protein BDF14DRAFT_1878550 [Spinellus fusiger]